MNFFFIEKQISINSHNIVREGARNTTNPMSKNNFFIKLIQPRLRYAIKGGNNEGKGEIIIYIP